MKIIKKLGDILFSFVVFILFSAFTLVMVNTVLGYIVVVRLLLTSSYT